MCWKEGRKEGITKGEGRYMINVSYILYLVVMVMMKRGGGGGGGEGGNDMRRVIGSNSADVSGT